MDDESLLSVSSLLLDSSASAACAAAAANACGAAAAIGGSQLSRRQWESKRRFASHARRLGLLAGHMGEVKCPFIRAAGRRLHDTMLGSQAVRRV